MATNCPWIPFSAVWMAVTNVLPSGDNAGGHVNASGSATVPRVLSWPCSRSRTIADISPDLGFALMKQTLLPSGVRLRP